MMNLSPLETAILEHFPADHAIRDYHGQPIDQPHVRHYLQQARQRIEIICQRVRYHASPASRVLEVGTAYGLALLHLQAAGFAVEGADLAENIDTYCRPLLAEGIPVTPWDLHRDCPFPAPAFEVVIASEVLEHLQVSLKTAVAHLARVLKPNGYLILSTPNLYRLPNLLKIVRGHNICEPFPDQPALHDGVVIDNRTHPREPTRRELSAAAVQNGLAVVEQSTFNTGTFSAWKQAVLALTPPAWGNHLLLVAQKK